MESVIEILIASLYCLYYLVLIVIDCFALGFYDTETGKCELSINKWLEASGFFYLTAALSSASLLLYIRKHGELNFRIVDLVLVECLFVYYTKK